MEYTIYPKKDNKNNNYTVILNHITNAIIVKGPLGELSHNWNYNYVKIIDEKNIYFSDKKYFKVFEKTLKNMIKGVCQGWFVELELVGLGYRVFYLNEKKTIGLDLGYSHIFEYDIPSDLNIKCMGSKLLISGIDKVRVNTVAATIYNLKKPDKYKKKGFHYRDKN